MAGTTIPVDRTALAQALETAKGISTNLKTLTDKGYGDTDITKLPGGDIKDLPQNQPATLVDRYAKDKTDLSSIYGETTKPDEEAIRTAERARAQASIDAINAKYAKIDAADQETIDLMNRERRASNVLNGLTGSDAAVAKTIETAKAGDKVRDLSAQAKAADLETVYSNADTRASDQFQKEKAAFIQNSKDKYVAEQGLNEKIKTNALNEIKTLAANHSFDETKQSNPQLIQQYLNETGLDENTLKATWASSAPAGTYQWDKASYSGNSLVVPHVVGNKVTLETIQAPAGVNITDGWKFVAGSTSHGAMWVNEKTQQVKSADGGGGTEDTATLKSDVDGAVSQFQQKMKAKGWAGVNPTDYQVMADYMQKTYGTAGVAKLKTAMKAVGISIDDVNK